MQLATTSRPAATSNRAAELLDAVETRLDRLEISGVAEAHGFVVTEGDARDDGEKRSLCTEETNELDGAFGAWVPRHQLRASAKTSLSPEQGRRWAAWV